MKGAGLAVFIVGAIVTVIGLIWGAVGVYLSLVPVLLVMLAGGSLLMWVGSRMNRDKDPRSAVAWTPTGSASAAQSSASAPAIPAVPAPQPVVPVAVVPVVESSLAPSNDDVEPSVEPVAADSGSVDDATVAVFRLPRSRSRGLEFPDGARRELGSTALLGRAPEAIDGEIPGELWSIPGPDETVSKTHALVRNDGARITVRDLGSANGTVVLARDGSETACPAGVDVEAPEGATIELGTYPIRVYAEANVGRGGRR